MRPRWVMTPEEVAILDANAEALGADMDDLMKTAAEHLANALEGAPSPIWILCGPGNNGGDGFRLAGMLEECYCLLYTSPSPRDRTRSRMPSSA